VAGREAIPDLRATLKDRAWDVRWAAAQALAQVWQRIGREAIPDLRAALKDEDRDVRWAAAHALAKLGAEDDLDWLAEWVTRNPLSEIGDVANGVLIRLDRKLYCPWPSAAFEK